MFVRSSRTCGQRWDLPSLCLLPQRPVVVTDKDISTVCPAARSGRRKRAGAAARSRVVRVGMCIVVEVRRSEAHRVR